MNLAFSSTSRAKKVLERSANDIQTCSFTNYGGTLFRLVHQIKAEPLFSVGCEALDRRRPSAEALTVKEGVRYLSLPPVDDDRCAILWGLVQDAAQNPERGSGFALSVAIRLTGMVRDQEECLRTFTIEAVLPVISYLEQTIAVGHELVSLTWRYKRMIEWFRFKELANLAASGWPEEPLDEDYRRFLMEAGFDFPFSQVHIPASRPDVVVLDDEKSPLPIEVKVFDGSKRGIEKLRTGFGQAVDYARKYQSPFGLLIIFNVSKKGALAFKSSGRYPHFEHQNLVVYVIPIELVPLPAPSSTAGALTVEIQSSDLFDT